MSDIREAKPHSSSAEQTIGLHRQAIAALEAHPRDPRAIGLAARIRAFLANFPEHFVTEYLARDKAGKVTVNRVPLGDWPDWTTQAQADRAGPALVAVSEMPLQPDDDSGMVRGEGFEAIEAIQELALQLGVECTAAAIEERIAELLEIERTLQVEGGDDADR